MGKMDGFRRQGDVLGRGCLQIWHDGKYQVCPFWEMSSKKKEGAVRVGGDGYAECLQGWIGVERLSLALRCRKRTPLRSEIERHRLQACSGHW